MRAESRSPGLTAGRTSYNGEATTISEPEHSPTLELASTSPSQTRRLGRRLGEALRAGDVVLLEGEFGAGKTVLSQGIAAGLGVRDYVTSPSFTLINEYRGARGGLVVYHVDLYRLDNPAEAVDLGLLDYVGGEGVVLIEWAERVREQLPPEYLLATLAVAGVTRRVLRFTAFGERHRALLAEFAAALAEA